MLNISKRIFFLSIAAIGAISIQAQTLYHLPSTHESQHRDLLASQSPLMEKLKLENTQKFIQDIEDREGIDDSDIFGAFWDTQTVNPYGNVAIPDHKDILLGEFVHPHDGRVTSEFGYRPRFGRVHKGIDIKLNVGDTVRACFDGKVRVARYNPGGFGYFVIVRHDNGLETLYGHLKRFTVKPGQVVKAGQMIGYGGNTGRSTGPHLHLETRYMGMAINPRAIIDFDNKTTHKDVFAFDRHSTQKAVNYAPARAKYSKAKYAKYNKKGTKKSRKKGTRRKSRRR